MASPYDHDDKFYFDWEEINRIAALMVDMNATEKQIEEMESILSDCQNRAAPTDWDGREAQHHVSLQRGIRRATLLRDPHLYWESLALLKKPDWLPLDTWKEDFRAINDIELAVDIRLNLMDFIGVLQTDSPLAWEASARRLLADQDKDAPCPAQYGRHSKYTTWHDRDRYGAMVLQALNSPESEDEDELD